MEPEKRSQILARVDALLCGFDGFVHHGSITIHLGENDYEIELSRRDLRQPLVDVTARPTTKPGWKNTQ